MDPLAPQPLHALLNERFFVATDDDENLIFDEEPKAGTTETWQFINTTGDAHPMHMHLVIFQVVDRQTIDTAAYLLAHAAWVRSGRSGAAPTITAHLRGLPMAPAPEETGWKDTIKPMPGEVTRIITRFDLPPQTTVPAEYVYHCHILEHEDNEMMRSFSVVP